MWLLDYSLDNLSLMALTIATGFVVDDAIVVTENVMRLIEEGKTPHDAAFEGAKQIGFTIISITPILMTTLAALLGALPLALGSGSELRRPLGIAIVGGLTVSQMLTLFTVPVTYLAFDRFKNYFRPLWLRIFAPIHRR
ncbi:hypothetical protein BH11MYX2_BH11MYX2_10810 [soil metagenome]